MLKILFSLYSFIIVILCEINNNNNNIDIKDILKEEIDYLSDLPLVDLIKIKKSLNELNIKSDINNIANNIKNDDNLYDENIAAEYIESKEDLMESRALPSTVHDLTSLPLVGGVIEKFLNKTSKLNHIFGGRHKSNEGGRSSVERSYEHGEHKEPSKIESIFQISVTGLSFLAFGGYLLCMIVQAIKSRGTTYYHPATTAVANQNAQPIKKIKVYRRSKRTVVKEKLKKNKFKYILENNNDYMSASPSPDDMYGILKLFAEGYVKLVDN